MDVTIASLALQKLGADDQISGPDQQGAAPGAVRAAWDPVRKLVLRTGKFNFALTSAELAAQLAGSPGWSNPYPFSHRFPLPSGCLRFVAVLSPASAIDRYRIRRGAVHADTAGPMIVEYVDDVAVPALWDALFVEAFAARLAFQIADRITGDEGRKVRCWNEYRAAIKEAAGADAKEDPPEETPDSSWITSRYG